MGKSILLLVNPVSGNGKNVGIAKKIFKKLTDENWLITSYISQKKGDLTQYIQTENLEQFSHIGIVGGDGTLHEVVNGTMLRQEKVNIPILLFPCGSGNSLNHDIGCFTVDEALERLKIGKTLKIDLIETIANNEKIWGFNIVGFGLVNEINILAEKMRWLGGMRYTLASVLGILKNPKYNAQIIIDSQQYEGPFCFVLISNTIHTGKAMKMSPLAQLSDGYLDVIVVKHLAIWQLFKLFPLIFSGGHIRSPLLQYIHAKSIKIYPENPQIGNIDGEVKGESPFEISIVPAALEIIC